MKELTKEETTRRVHNLEEILNTCYAAAGVIVSAGFNDGLDSGWMGQQGSIKAVDHYMNRLEAMLKNLGRSHARTLLARELFIAVMRGDLSIQEIAEEGSEA